MSPAVFLINSLLFIILGGGSGFGVYYYLNNENFSFDCSTAVADSGSPQKDSIKPQIQAGNLTRANYAKIKEGMTYEEVARILGPGKNNGEVTVKESIYTDYSWMTEDLSVSINIGFRNGKLTSKFQRGL